MITARYIMELPAQHLKTGPGAAQLSPVAPSPARIPGLPEAPRTGYGEVHAHHGEVLQGVFHSSGGRLEPGLVTMPCHLYITRADFRPVRSAPLVVEPAGRFRARAAARLMLDTLGRTGWGGTITIKGNVPLGWGCGSSTSDVLAVSRAVADAFSVSLLPERLARLAVAAETASDPLMYPPNESVLFAPRAGRKLLELGGPLPAVQVLGFNTDVFGGGLDTLALPACRYSWWEIEAFRPLLGLLRRAIEDSDPRLLGRVATASAQINQGHRPKAVMLQLLEIAKATGAVGIQVAHSGTVAGFLFEPGSGTEGRVEDARARLRELGLHRTWLFSTDSSQKREPIP